MHFERQMPFKMHKFFFFFQKKKKISVPSLPKIFRPVTRNTLIFLFGLTWLRWMNIVCVISMLVLSNFLSIYTRSVEEIDGKSYSKN